jgi:hypothetical protein
MIGARSDAGSITNTAVHNSLKVTPRWSAHQGRLRRRAVEAGFRSAAGEGEHTHYLDLGVVAVHTDFADPQTFGWTFIRFTICCAHPGSTLVCRREMHRHARPSRSGDIT